VDYGPKTRQLRREVREWLEANAPADLQGVRMPRRPEGGLAKALTEWADKMTAAGWMCVTWPQAVGGRGLSAVDVAVLEEEFARAGVPRVGRAMGESLVGPSIIVHGTDEQRDYFLPRIITGVDKYCQGFSEPDAGSDLASLRTRATVDGDEIIVTGEKVWTSWYWDATMLFCLCRTDPSVEKHRGISYVLLPIRRPDTGGANGVEFRPLRQLTGESHFAATHLTEARAPLFNVIGGINEGWRVAMTTLGNERGGRAITQHVMFESAFWDLAAEADRRGRTADPQVRQALAWAYSQVSVIRFQGQRLAAALVGGQEPGRATNPSLTKVFWSEFQQRLAELALDILGPEATITGPGGEWNRWQQMFFTSRSDTIWGGTAQIQRNILAERVLGLPKDAPIER
jgi:hypothetical protein